MIMTAMIRIVFPILLLVIVGCGDDEGTSISPDDNQDAANMDASASDASTQDASTQDAANMDAAMLGSVELNNFLVAAKKIGEVVCPCSNISLDCEGKDGKYFNITPDVHQCLADTEMKYQSETMMIFTCMDGPLNKIVNNCSDKSCNAITACAIINDGAKLQGCVSGVSAEVKDAFNACFEK